MEAEGVALDLALGALVGAKNTIYPVFFIRGPSGRLHARLADKSINAPPRRPIGDPKVQKEIKEGPVQS